MKDNKSDTIKFVSLAALNSISAILIPIGTAHYKWLTGAESVFLAALIWIGLTCIEILFYANALHQVERRELDLWSSQDAFDVRLSNIREAYRRILGNRRDIPDLFQSFCDDRIGDLEKLLVQAANRDELHLEHSHVVSVSVLLGSFKGDNSDIFRPVHFFEDNTFFFNIYGKQYFYRVYDLVQKKKIREVKRLMIYNDKKELNDEKSIRLMRFHAKVLGYSYKVMTMHDFRSMLRDYRLPPPRDFGIYGDKYVYCAEVNALDNIVGYWQRNTVTVQLYIQFFEACWNSPLASTIKSIDVAEDLSLDDLYDDQSITDTPELPVLHPSEQNQIKDGIREQEKAPLPISVQSRNEDET